MMDFGLSGLLDRIERDFGPRWAKTLTIMITVAIIAGCLTIVGNLISAFSLWMSGITSESTLWAKILYVGKYAAGIALLITVANHLVFVTTAKTQQKILLEQVSEVSDLAKRGKEGDTMLQENLSRFGDIVKRLEEITEDEAVAANLRNIYDTISEHREKRRPSN